MQEGMLFHTIYSPQSEVYKEQFSCKLVGELDLESFKRAWAEIINRHDILRTAFVWEDVDEPLQIVHKKVDLPFYYSDISNLKNEEQNKFIQKSLRNNLKQTFEFNEAPLMNVTLYKLSITENFLIWDYHHILFDGWECRC